MATATADPLEVLLRGWGAWHQRNRPVVIDREYIARADATRSHAIARVSPGRRKTKPVSQRRGGHELRRITGQPLWATEPMRCVETRTRAVATPHDIPDHVRRVDSAELYLRTVDLEFAAVIRIEYCEDGTQEEKARELGLEVRRYRDRLLAARLVLRGFLRIA